MWVCSFTTYSMQRAGVTKYKNDMYPKDLERVYPFSKGGRWKKKKKVRGFLFERGPTKGESEKKGFKKNSDTKRKTRKKSSPSTSPILTT